MPIPIPKGEEISIQKNLYPHDFSMRSMEIAESHYDINYVVTGDRKIITPTHSYSYHAGDISVGKPYTYHRTMSESNTPYERYLIKFTPKIAEPFIQSAGRNIFNELFERGLFHFSPSIQTKINDMCSEMLYEYNKNVHYKGIILQGMLYRLLAIIYENRHNADITKNKSPLTEPIIMAVHFINGNYNKNITLETVAKTVHFSTSHFSRLFHSQLGITFSEYLSDVRINQAKRLLLQTDKSIMEIALDTGYCHGDYFSYQFKNKTNLTPSQFRRKKNG